MALRTWLAGWTALALTPGLEAQVAEREAAAPGSPSEATGPVSPTTAIQALQPAATSGSSLDASIGTSLSSGHFGLPTTTSILSTAFGLRYASGGLRLTGSVPWMRIRSASRIFTGIDSTPVLIGGPSLGRRRTVSGLGDLTLGAAYTLPAAPAGVEVEVSGRIKLPTASDNRLTSGKVDGSMGLQLTRVVGRLAPFASVTYRVFGDPRGLDLRDGFAASAGTSLVAGPVVLLASYHYAQRASDFVRDSHELFAGASGLLVGRLRGTAFVTKGLSRGAAAVSGGLGLALAL